MASTYRITLELKDTELSEPAVDEFMVEVLQEAREHLDEVEKINVQAVQEVEE